jgi:hypothetical protein
MQWDQLFDTTEEYLTNLHNKFHIRNENMIHQVQKLYGEPPIITITNAAAATNLLLYVTTKV